MMQMSSHVYLAPQVSENLSEKTFSHYIQILVVPQLFSYFHVFNFVEKLVFVVPGFSMPGHFRIVLNDLHQ